MEIRRQFHRPSTGGLSSTSFLTDSFMWNDRDCSTKNFFLCERALGDGKLNIFAYFHFQLIFIDIPRELPYYGLENSISLIQSLAKALVNLRRLILMKFPSSSPQNLQRESTRKTVTRQSTYRTIRRRRYSRAHASPASIPTT